MLAWNKSLAERNIPLLVQAFIKSNELACVGYINYKFRHEYNWDVTETCTAWKVFKCGVFSGPYFPVFGLNTEIYSIDLRIQSECRKIRTWKNSLFKQFSRSDVYCNVWPCLSGFQCYLKHYYNLYKLCFCHFLPPDTHTHGCASGGKKF